MVYSIPMTLQEAVEKLRASGLHVKNPKSGGYIVGSASVDKSGPVAVLVDCFMIVPETLWEDIWTPVADPFEGSYVVYQESVTATPKMTLEDAVAHMCSKASERQPKSL